MTDFLIRTGVDEQDMSDCPYNRYKTLTSIEVMEALAGAKALKLLKLSCLLEQPLCLQSEHATEETLIKL
jgi:hypothetical protein